MEPALRSPSHQRGNRLRLPGTGTLYVLADLHGHAGDLEALFAQEPGLGNGLREGSAQLLLLGDLTDLKNRASPDDDHRLCEHVAGLKEEHPDNVHVLASDHDLANLRLYDTLRGLLRGEAVKRKQERESYRMLKQFSTYRKWDAGDRAPALFRGAPLLATTENGLAFVHAGVPATSHYALEAIAELTPFDLAVGAVGSALHDYSPNARIAESFLWGRYGPFYLDKGGGLVNGVLFEQEDVVRFLERADASLLVTGHQMLIGNSGYREGWHSAGRLAILETSTGARAYLKVPLDPQERRITGPESIRRGKELRRLA